METSRNWDGSPETAAETRFHYLRASGWHGPIDQNGYRVDDLDSWIEQNRPDVRFFLDLPDDPSRAE